MSMKNIEINGICEYADLDRKLWLQNGSIIIHRLRKNVVGAYLVTSFRDGENKYPGQCTTNYCTLVNLDTGQYAFPERCSRSTTERRILRHIERLGFKYPYNPDDKSDDYRLQGMRVQVYASGDYKIKLELGNEYIYGRKQESL